MAAKRIDPTEFRDAQRNQWNRAASGWKKWVDKTTATHQPVSDRLVELALIGAGSRVLDVAAGYGEPALTAARKVGPEGHVVATDIAPEMLAFGRERAAAAGVANLEFVECEASALEFAPQSFDAAISRWGIIFDPEAEATAARIRSFLKPGGRIAISSWGPPAEAPLIALPMSTVLGYLQQPPPPAGTPGPLSRPTPEAIGAILDGGGFSEVEVDEVRFDVDWDSPEEFTAFIKDIVAPLVTLLEQHPPEVREGAWNAVTEAAREHTDGDGRVVLTNKALVASGRA